MLSHAVIAMVILLESKEVFDLVSVDLLKSCLK